ncbi:MAG: hypothetical protein Q4C86_07585 [bacterium]|uniref:hypothetical protein n=1 Tax=Cloacibacillus TaxID=508459 RepID=UPI002109E84F|nr:MULTISPECIES: hypothetical protein [Cloacibacillus]MCQ4764803.1 hypothetical protein [Cloacibacillus evryensis]MDD7649245.1 hypothetical protein [Cloacibacillus porcorum]MDO4560798.1 hypothetical protein [bacterium]MDY4093566.1 hypothetical protein [Cloacibacillus porcorum]
MRENADYRDRCRVAKAELRKLQQRIDALLDAPNPRKDGYWNPYDYKKLTAAIRRQSMEVSNILVGLRKPL